MNILNINLYKAGLVGALLAFGSASAFASDVIPTVISDVVDPKIIAIEETLSTVQSLGLDDQSATFTLLNRVNQVLTSNGALKLELAARAGVLNSGFSSFNDDVIALENASNDVTDIVSTLSEDLKATSIFTTYNFLFEKLDFLIDLAGQYNLTGWANFLSAYRQLLIDFFVHYNAEARALVDQAIIDLMAQCAIIDPLLVSTAQYIDDFVQLEIEITDFENSN